MYPNLLWIKGSFVIVDTHKKERAHVICFSFVSSRLISMVGENIKKRADPVPEAPI